MKSFALPNVTVEEFYQHVDREQIPRDLVCSDGRSSFVSFTIPGTAVLKLEEVAQHYVKQNDMVL